MVDSSDAEVLSIVLVYTSGPKSRPLKALV